MNPHLAVISLWAEDVQSCARFYRDVIGLSAEPHHGTHPHFKVGQTHLIILEGRPRPAEDPDPSRFPLMAFSVDSLSESVDRLEVNKVDMPWGVEHDANSHWVMFHDPAGNLIELVEFDR